ncbi:hypothetical protein [Bacillus subtilis]|uniref:hypothetical protein n=1 Tax=Bacillus subtilis TaxID=1423 RepID=UPI001BDB9B62|nr:hypothetical protein [Bacillus subtilis]MED1819977.1 hypothetical protein [Bacillus subtilis]
MDLINTKENIKLLSKYLIKLYGADKAKKLFEHFSKQQNLFGEYGLAYQVGRNSISFFCEYFLQDLFTPKKSNTARKLAPVHYEVWKSLEDIFIHQTHDKQEYILPRGSAKTTIVDVALSCWLHCYKVSRYTVVLANKGDEAEDFIKKTKIALQYPYIINTFGELVVYNKKRVVNKSELELDNNTKIKAYSAGGSGVRGTSYSDPEGGIYRPMVFIADDYISELDVLTKESRVKKYDRWLKEVEEAGDEAVERDGVLIKPATKFLVLGTPLAPGDFIDRIKENPEYMVFQRSVVDFDIDDYFERHEKWQEFKRIFFDDRRANALADSKAFYDEHKEEMYFPTIWEGKYNCLKLAMKYFNKRVAFMQELMCKVEDVGDKWFTSNKVRSREEIESLKHIKTMLSVDTAGVKVKDARRSDFFAFVVGSVATNGFKYVRKGQIRKFIDDFDGYVNHVIGLLEEFPDINCISIEKNQFNGLDVDRIKQAIEDHPQLKRRQIEFINEMSRKNKDDRISTIVSDVNNGRIIFCKDRVEESALEQMMDFSGQAYTRHDDFVDALSDFANKVDDIEIRNKRIRSMKKSVLGI